jgi:peroxiredoxin Q/BCP
MLNIGDKAPEIIINNQDSEEIDVLKKAKADNKSVVIYFYPKASTPGCTVQSCALRDAMPELEKLDAIVYGISPDKEPALQKFTQKHEFGFDLLADPDHTVSLDYDVWTEKSMFGKKYMGIVRSAFVISPDGLIKEAFYKISPKDTVPKVEEALKS